MIESYAAIEPGEHDEVRSWSIQVHVHVQAQHIGREDDCIIRVLASRQVAGVENSGGEQ